jgi:hypothetical protein
MSDPVSTSNYRSYFYTAEVSLAGLEGNLVRRVNGYLSILPPPSAPVEKILSWGKEVEGEISRLLGPDYLGCPLFITLLQPLN